MRLVLVPTQMLWHAILLLNLVLGTLESIISKNQHGSSAFFLSCERSTAYAKISAPIGTVNTNREKNFFNWNPSGKDMTARAVQQCFLFLLHFLPNFFSPLLLFGSFLFLLVSGPTFLNCFDIPCVWPKGEKKLENRHPFCFCCWWCERSEGLMVISQFSRVWYCGEKQQGSS